MQPKRHIQLLGLVALAVSLTPSLLAQRNAPGQPPQRPGPTTRCESRNNRRNYCAADPRGGVTLLRQLSQAQCVQGRTWGFDARGIWVQAGCRAEFQVNAYNGNPNWGNPGQGHRPPDARRTELGNSGACFYKEINFGGEYFCMKRGESYSSLPPGYNDRISAIKVFGGARDVANLKNWRTPDDPSRTWNDRISSIQVR